MCRHGRTGYDGLTVWQVNLKWQRLSFTRLDRCEIFGAGVGATSQQLPSNFIWVLLPSATLNRASRLRPSCLAYIRLQILYEQTMWCRVQCHLGTPPSSPFRFFPKRPALPPANIELLPSQLPAPRPCRPMGVLGETLANHGAWEWPQNHSVQKLG